MEKQKEKKKKPGKKNTLGPRGRREAIRERVSAHVGPGDGGEQRLFGQTPV